MFSDSKNVTFEREIKIFYAALFFKTIFTFQTRKKTSKKNIYVHT